MYNDENEVNIWTLVNAVMHWCGPSHSCHHVFHSSCWAGDQSHCLATTYCALGWWPGFDPTTCHHSLLCFHWGLWWSFRLHHFTLPDSYLVFHHHTLVIPQGGGTLVKHFLSSSWPELLSPWKWGSGKVGWTKEYHSAPIYNILQEIYIIHFHFRGLSVGLGSLCPKLPYTYQFLNYPKHGWQMRWLTYLWIWGLWRWLMCPPTFWLFRLGRQWRCFSFSLSCPRLGLAWLWLAALLRFTCEACSWTLLRPGDSVSST